MQNLLRVSDPSSRRVGAAVLAGVVAGVLSGFVKLGWEQLLPPRTADRQVPPLVLLDKLGIHTGGATFTFSGTQVNWASLVVHFAFSIITVIVYCVLAEYLPGVKLARGMAFGVGVWVVFHLGLLPALGLTPATGALPFEENLSEFLGHAVWLLAAELVRREVRNRITGARDAEAASQSRPLPQPALR